MSKKLWFAAKEYGWGWYPVTWQGWAILSAFVVYELFLVILIGQSFDSRPGITSFLFLTTIGVSVLITLCLQFGETPRWRWGKKK